MRVQPIGTQNTKGKGKYTTISTEGVENWHKAYYFINLLMIHLCIVYFDRVGHLNSVVCMDKENKILPNNSKGNICETLGTTTSVSSINICLTKIQFS